MKNDTVTLAHGNGGVLTHELIDRVFKKRFQNPILGRMEDSALLDLPPGKAVFTTDSFVVSPIIFPGGDIGKLSVAGTVNDLAVMGARPLYLSCSVIIEEGFSLSTLERIADSLQKAADEAGVFVVTGDTKVVEKGKADGIFINTAGIGILEGEHPLGAERLCPGDSLLINGTIGDHGMAILTAREDFPLTTELVSDCAPLNSLIQSILDAASPGEIKVMRDPTRGGIGTTLNEFVQGAAFGIQIDERALPIRDDVRTLSEMTGFDPLYIANEGKVLVFVSGCAEEKILKVMKKHPLGRDSAVIGRVTEHLPGRVVLNSEIGAKRIVDMLVSDMLPRIC